jgi:ATP-dependent protease HslVU (ClpYQ) ATPase subunit
MICPHPQGTQNALIKQYVGLMETEGIKLSFRTMPWKLPGLRLWSMNGPNTEPELHTIMERLLMVSFEGPDLKRPSWSM